MRDLTYKQAMKEREYSLRAESLQYAVETERLKYELAVYRRLIAGEMDLTVIRGQEVVKFDEAMSQISRMCAEFEIEGDTVFQYHLIEVQDAIRMDGLAFLGLIEF